ncbi:PREDICTED: mucin-21-like, partial [Rhagoletis zephyria]|uniref:mucin-21-like n=1 Tax=Rhagoletis zephyria TaxID=28612 RepID=UPI0008115A21
VKGKEKNNFQYNTVTNCATQNPPSGISNTAATAAGLAAAPTSAPDTPPPPIPRRTFRGSYAWNTAIDSPTLTSANQTPTKDKQHISTGTAFVYPPQTQTLSPCRRQQSHTVYYNTSGVNPLDSPQIPNQLQSQSLLVDLATRPLYVDAGLDAGGISDDDRMSLENSVFDESLTSTPVKVASKVATEGTASGKLANSAFTAKTLVAFTGELSNAAKRANRSSSSTADSTITNSSGYGSGHSERFASSSTSADFRSRFSSVDTQSSMDSCPAEKTSDFSLSKDCYKMERTMLNDALNDYNNLNNNETRTHIACNTVASNNNTLGSRQSTNATSQTLSGLNQQKPPTVPARKQYGDASKIPHPCSQNSSQQSLQSSGCGSGSGSVGSSKGTSTVSASTSTSSTVSAGSGTSSGSLLSGSGTASNTAISPLTQNSAIIYQQPKRPVPPVPPARGQIISEHNVNNSTQIETTTSSKAPPPAVTIRNKLGKSKPPPIVYPKLHQRQDSNLSSDSFSVTSSPGYNSKN